MPYEQHYVPTPSDPTLPVLSLADLPGWYERPTFTHFRQFFRRINGRRKYYYECKHCRGIVEGQPAEYRVNTLAPLSGRRGTEYYCRRCGNEISFVGMVS